MRRTFRFVHVNHNALVAGLLAASSMTAYAESDATAKLKDSFGDLKDSVVSLWGSTADWFGDVLDEASDSAGDAKSKGADVGEAARDTAAEASRAVGGLFSKLAKKIESKGDDD